VNDFQHLGFGSVRNGRRIRVCRAVGIWERDLDDGRDDGSWVVDGAKLGGGRRFDE
jgi:hypothetical protein